MARWRVLLLIAFTVVGAACADAEETTTTGAASADDVIFGEGTMPDTIPDDFPLPAGSAIGSTLVIKDGLTEVVIRVGAEQGVTAEFFNQSLARAGYSVDRSEAANGGWAIEFGRDSAKGTLDISEPVEGISQIILRYNLP